MDQTLKPVDVIVLLGVLSVIGAFIFAVVAGAGYNPKWNQKKVKK